MPKALQISELKTFSFEKFGQIYDYIGINSKNGHRYVDFVCNDHGTISQRLDKHLTIGCPSCAKIKSRKKRGVLVHNVGIVDIPVKEIHKKAYVTWQQMLRRCYDKKYSEREPSYSNVEVCEEWKTFSNFLSWFIENYKEGYELDKDLLKKGNKLYSPNLCTFLPNEINNGLSYLYRNKGVQPIGVVQRQHSDGSFYYSSKINKFGKYKYLGTFDSIEDAFNAYKMEKEEYFRELAKKYKDTITKHAYNALMNYKIDISDKFKL